MSDKAARDAAIKRASAQAREGIVVRRSRRKAIMTGHHHRLSTHLIRRTARSAQRHYEQLQLEADMEGPAGEYARTACARLHIGLMDAIVVRKALYERGKWVVVAEGA